MLRELLANRLRPLDCQVGRQRSRDTEFGFACCVDCRRYRLVRGRRRDAAQQSCQSCSKRQ